MIKQHTTDKHAKPGNIRVLLGVEEYAPIKVYIVILNPSHIICKYNESRPPFTGLVAGYDISNPVIKQPESGGAKREIYGWHQSEKLDRGVKRVFFYNYLF